MQAHVMISLIWLTFASISTCSGNFARGQQLFRVELVVLNPQSAHFHGNATAVQSHLDWKRWLEMHNADVAESATLVALLGAKAGAEFSASEKIFFLERKSNDEFLLRHFQPDSPRGIKLDFSLIDPATAKLNLRMTELVINDVEHMKVMEQIVPIGQPTVASCNHELQFKISLGKVYEIDVCSPSGRLVRAGMNVRPISQNKSITQSVAQSQNDN